MKFAAEDVVKVSPVKASASYLAHVREAWDRAHPEHPLAAQGYPSIGCWPCTRPVKPGEDPRSGRWTDSGKTECGLHGWPQP